MEGCEPTVGEVRECANARTMPRSRVDDADEWVVSHDTCGPSRIVEVAPKNRARVTAGPYWMGRS